MAKRRLRGKQKEAKEFRTKKIHGKKDLSATKNKSKFKSEIAHVEEAFNGKAKNVTIKPSHVGKYKKNNYDNILVYYLKKATKLAMTQMPKDADFKLHVEATFDGKMGDGTIRRHDLTTKKFNQNEIDDMLLDLTQRFKIIYDSILLSTISLKYKFITIPKGSGKTATTSREKESIYAKKSVNKVVNDDNNCFGMLWLCLFMLTIQRLKP